MRQVFEASDMLEAHVVKGLLQQEGVTGFIQGEYLQGGIGDLPVSGTVRIDVNNEDFDQAKLIIKQWEQSQPLESIPQDTYANTPQAWLYPFVIGLGVGILLCVYIFNF